MNYSPLTQTEFRVGSKHLPRSRRGLSQVRCLFFRAGPGPCFVFQTNVSLVVKATVTHSEARERCNPSPGSWRKEYRLLELGLVSRMF